MLTADLVLEGGGMKGIGLSGATAVLMRAGYEFPRVAGTSAGALVGAFVAAGADADRLTDMMGRLDWEQIPDRAKPGIPLVSEGISLLHEGGIHPGDYLHGFVRDELAALGVRTFADLRRSDPGADPNLDPSQRYKLVVMATDVTRGRLLRLPWDYREQLGLDPDAQLVADAVRASLSIPLYFEPVVVSHAVTGEEITLVDGGVLSGYPIEIFDRTDSVPPRWPTFGVKILPALPERLPELFPGVALAALPPVKLLEQVAATAIVGHDQTYLARPCVQRRTIKVDTSAVGVVEFDASPRQRQAVLAAGEAAAEAFLPWDDDAYLRECRPQPASAAG